METFQVTEAPPMLLSNKDWRQREKNTEPETTRLCTPVMFSAILPLSVFHAGGKIAENLGTHFG